MSRSSLRSTGWSLPLAALIAALVPVVWMDAASGQTVTPFEVRRILIAQDASAAAKKTMTDYLRGSFGQYAKPADGGTLPLLRKEYGNIVRSVPDNPAHSYFSEMTYKGAMSVIGNKQAGIAARYNAMLLLADLNQSDAAGGVKPFPKAFAIVKAVLAFPPDHDYAFLKPAALVGITRYAQENAIPAGEVGAISASLLELVNDADPPAGRSASAHNFLRCRAAGALALMGSLGPDNAVLKAFESILMDPNTRTTMRCEVIQDLGILNYPAQAKVDLQKLANLIGHQTIEICRQELDKAEADQRDPSRRTLMYAAYSGGVGLAGVSRAAANNGDKAASFVSGVKNKIGALYKVLDDLDGTPDTQLADAVSERIDEIRSDLLEAPAAGGPMVATGPTKEETAQPGTTN